MRLAWRSLACWLLAFCGVTAHDMLNDNKHGRLGSIVLFFCCVAFMFIFPDEVNR